MCGSHAALYAVVVHYVRPYLPVVVSNIPMCYVKSSCRLLCSLPSVSHPRRRPVPSSSWLLGSSVAFSKHCLCVTASSRDHTGVPQISPKRCWYPLSVSRQGSAWSCDAKSKFGHSTMANPFKSCYPIMWRPCGLRQMYPPRSCAVSQVYSPAQKSAAGRQYSQWNTINNKLKTIYFVMSFYCPSLQPSQCKYLLFHFLSSPVKGWPTHSLSVIRGDLFIPAATLTSPQAQRTPH